MTVTRVRSVNLWYIMTRVKSLYIISLVHKELTHIFQGDSGGPLYKFDEASRRAILGSLMFRSFFVLYSMKQLEWSTGGRAVPERTV